MDRWFKPDSRQHRGQEETKAEVEILLNEMMMLVSSAINDLEAGSISRCSAGIRLLPEKIGIVQRRMGTLNPEADEGEDDRG